MTNQQINEFSLRITQAGKCSLAAITCEIADVYISDAMNVQGDSYVLSIKRAQQCVDNLISSLNMDIAISMELLVIYQYMKNVLRDLRSRSDKDKLETVRRMLGRLRRTFEELALSDTTGPVMSNTQKVYAGLTYGQGTLNETCTQDINRGYLV